MRLLLDTNLLLWTAIWPDRLSLRAQAALEDETAELVFSAVSIWETAIKRGLGRDGFDVDPRRLRRGLADAGYEEWSVTGAHAAALVDLPPIHKDPFDRLLLAQATTEGVPLLTADPVLARYAAPVKLV